MTGVYARGERLTVGANGTWTPCGRRAENRAVLAHLAPARIDGTTHGAGP